MRYWMIAAAAGLAACGQAEPDAPIGDPSIPIAEAPIDRCVNLGSALEAPREGEWGYVIRQEDLVRIKEAGFDTIRLPVKWSAYTASASPFTIEDSILNRVDEILNWADQIGLQVVLNVHHYDELNEDPDTHEPRLEAMWETIASHYADAPSSLIFETINEPHTNMTTPRTDALNQRLLNRIRRQHPDRWVILGTAFWSNLSALEESRPSYDPKVMLTYHEYSPFEFTHQGTSWTEMKDTTGIRWGSRDDVSEMMSELDKVVAIQKRTRMPVFVGEFGVYEGVPIEHRERWTRTLRQGFESRGLSWCYWDYAGSLKVYDTDTEAWIPELKSALLD